MELILTLLFGGLAVGAGFVFRHMRLREWQNAAVACGLEVQEVSGWSHRITARSGPVQVKIDQCGNKGQYARIVVSLPGPPGLRATTIRHEPLLWRAQEIEIGDRSFDRKFSLEGPAPQILALLDAETRRVLIEADTAAEEEMVITSGTIRASDLSDRQIPRVLPLLLDVGRRLMQAADVPRRLAENARRDPEAGVRLQNLLCLIRELPEAPETIEALRTACSDPSPEIRLQAAQELGAEGRGTLFELAEGLEDDTCSAQAVSQLGRELPAERTQSILLDALRRRRIQTARACLESLGRSGDPAAVGVLAEVMARESGKIAAAAALALGATGSPAAEPPLLLALQREDTQAAAVDALAVDALAEVLALEKGELAKAAALVLEATGRPAAEPPPLPALQREEVDLRVAAVTALGRVGSVAAVLPLQEAAESSWLDLELRRTARQAIAEIQARLEGASPGQLSLADGEAGQLSFSEGEAGRLSLAQAEGGQLSLAHAEIPLLPHPVDELEPPSRNARETLPPES